MVWHIDQSLCHVIRCLQSRPSDVTFFNGGKNKFVHIFICFDTKHPNTFQFWLIGCKLYPNTPITRQLFCWFQCDVIKCLFAETGKVKLFVYNTVFFFRFTFAGKILRWYSVGILWFLSGMGSSKTLLDFEVSSRTKSHGHRWSRRLGLRFDLKSFLSRVEDSPSVTQCVTGRPELYLANGILMVLLRRNV